MVPGSFTAGRLDFASEHQNRVKRCRFDLKFDMEPFGGILRPSIDSDRRFDVFDIVAVGSSLSAVGGLKLGQMVSKWPETSSVVLPERTRVRSRSTMRLAVLPNPLMRPYSRPRRRFSMLKGTWKRVTRSTAMR
ncbi:hypothetical protein AAC387_Pa05g1129 [Persea americana]